ICQETCAPAPFEALPTAIPLLALPRQAMAHNIRALTVEAVKHLKNHESTLVCWSFSASRPRIEDSRSTPLKHLPEGKGRGNSNGLFHWTRASTRCRATSPPFRQRPPRALDWSGATVGMDHGYFLRRQARHPNRATTDSVG